MKKTKKVLKTGIILVMSMLFLPLSIRAESGEEIVQDTVENKSYELEDILNNEDSKYTERNKNIVKYTKGIMFGLTGIVVVDIIAEEKEVKNKKQG